MKQILVLWAAMAMATIGPFDILLNQGLGRDLGNEVVVLYNANLPESRGVAEYYAERRGVPARHLIGLKIPDTETNQIERAAFVKRMVQPLIRELEDRGLMHFQTHKVPASSNVVEHTAYTVDSARVRYLVMCYGLPYFVLPDYSIDGIRDEGAPVGTPPALLKNCASTDAELVVLPSYGMVPIAGALPNGAYGETNASRLHPTNGLWMVTRLDGPSPQIAKSLVDKAREAERDGLNGRAYFDLRGLKGGEYLMGDEWIGHGADLAARIGYETVVDREAATLGVGFPLSEVAIYAGWYATKVDGPFTLPTVEFMPGAIAYHLYSFSANAPRDPIKCWVGALLAKGATVTMGCVDEPFLGMTPNIGLFLERLALQKFTVGEASIACQTVLSWQTIVFGDPLYRPLAVHPLEQQQWYTLHPSPLVAWSLVRKVNLYLREGRDPDILQRYLMEQPEATNSPVLQEKIATMAASFYRFEEASDWGSRALKNGATPQQRGRLLRLVADWQRTQDPAGALANLEQFSKEFPRHPDLPAIRRDQIALATTLGLDETVRKLKAELSRLEAASSTNAPNRAK